MHGPDGRNDVWNFCNAKVQQCLHEVSKAADCSK